MTMKIDIQKLLCKRCGHEWVPKIVEVRICPKCKSAYWDKEKRDVNSRKGKRAV